MARIAGRNKQTPSCGVGEEWDFMSGGPDKGSEVCVRAELRAVLC